MTQSMWLEGSCWRWTLSFEDENSSNILPYKDMVLGDTAEKVLLEIGLNKESSEMADSINGVKTLQGVADESNQIFQAVIAEPYAAVSRCSKSQ